MKCLLGVWYEHLRVLWRQKKQGFPSSGVFPWSVAMMCWLTGSVPKVPPKSWTFTGFHSDLSERRLQECTEKYRSLCLGDVGLCRNAQERKNVSGVGWSEFYVFLSVPKGNWAALVRALCTTERICSSAALDRVVWANGRRWSRFSQHYRFSILTTVLLSFLLLFSLWFSNL